MNIDKKIKFHPSIIHANDIQYICKPLLHLSINYFSHMYISKNNEMSGHASNPEFLEHYLSNRHYNSDINMSNAEDIGKYIIWDEFELHGESLTTNLEAIEHGVDHTFTIIEADEHGKHYYNFASNLIGKSINQEYIRNLDLLEKFILYFKDSIKQSKALDKAYQIKFVPDEEAPGFECTQPDVSVPSDAKDKFQELIKANHPLQNRMNKFLFNKIDNLQLSVRQYQCLKFYVNGYKAKQIAAQLNISPRTVENYIHQIKQTLGVRTKAELILHLLGHNFHGMT